MRCAGAPPSVQDMRLLPRREPLDGVVALAAIIAIVVISVAASARRGIGSRMQVKSSGS
jgi:hypothetical protein